MISPLAVECALVSIGLPALLRAEAKWGIGKAADAAQLPRRMRTALSSFLGRVEPVAPAPLPPFDYDDVRDLIDGREEKAAQAVAAVFDAFEDSELAQGIIDRATAIVQDLAMKFPRNVRQELTGDVHDRPSDTEISRFALCWNVASDPSIVLADLAEHTLCYEQAEAFALYWPALHAEVAGDVIDILTTIKTKRPNWSLETERDRLVRLLLGAPKPPSGAGVDTQVAATSEKAQKPAPASALKPSADLLSEGQRSIGADR